ncbi:MAG: hypothetical protein RML32_04060 [Gammaproteobacteria bacterium]|nr:hypothetical protein [Gammaproteobacteria bacterium]
MIAGLAARYLTPALGVIAAASALLSVVQSYRIRALTSDQTAMLERIASCERAASSKDEAIDSLRSAVERWQSIAIQSRSAIDAARAADRKREQIERSRIVVDHTEACQHVMSISVSSVCPDLARSLRRLAATTDDISRG